MKLNGLILLASIPVMALMSCAQGDNPVPALPKTQVESPQPAPVGENKTAPAVKFDAGGQPDRSFVKISDRIGSRDPNSPDCEYLITVRNLHKTWSLKNVAVDINGTVYLIADKISPGQEVEFYRASLPRPLTSYHVSYQWEPPQ